MPWRARSFWIAAAAVAYAAFAALRASGGRGPAWFALTGLPLLLALAFRLTAPLVDRGRAGQAGHAGGAEDRIDPSARSAARAAVTGAALLLATRTGPASSSLLALGNLGAAIASIAALWSLSRMAGLGGLLQPPPTARRLDAAAFASLFWTIAVALPAADAVIPERAIGLDPSAIAYATTTAALGALAIIVVALVRVRIDRRLELGVADRTEAALLFTLTALSIGVLAALAGVARPESLLPLTSTIASLCVAISVVSGNPAALSRALRVTLALAALATPVALLAVYIVHDSPLRLDAAERTLVGLPRTPLGAAVFVACAACAIAGLFAPRLSRRFAPEGARWLRGLDAAARAALHPDPDTAMEAALLALRDLWDGRGPARPLPRPGLADRPPSPVGPALYRLAPPERVTVDLAGYAHRERTEIPQRLVTLADDEPEGVLRIEVLEAAQVRRAEVRPLLAWLEERGIGTVAAVRDAIGPAGALALPRAGRRAPMTLEEVEGLRMLADRLGAVLSAAGMLARSREREMDMQRKLTHAETESDRLARELAHGEARRRGIAERLARPARVGAYSPAARAAVEHIERLSVGGRPVTLLSGPGIDAVAWASLAHLASPRSGGPFTLVDGTGGAEHTLARWRDPDTSPVETARGGTLVVLDAHVLPADVQDEIGASLPDDVGLVVSVPQTPDVLVAAGQMGERLADRLGDRAVALPTLADRGEDLRALSLEQLARLGTRLRGRPLGLDLHALSLILEYPWPGNDAELAAVLLRAVLVTEGDVVGVRELTAIGFQAATTAPLTFDTSDLAPPAPRRRRSSKRA
ncbi:hypothetical protein [Chondromyces apiculatus]|uniref:Nitrogen regulation protein NR(I) n=1 Tax=Chondromyces apiculatus DSM 436 TaxID=1192034 RepID=A0A017TEW5_9BACT|nr:hypothetical protein [Chondromyces apiculatus]EYF07452.1 Nitrogen regulation protein NR(I) [Chondromyces apiculatus DSM 436]